VCDQNIAEARSIFRTSSSDRSETSPAGRRDARTRLRDLRRVHRVRLVAALDLACIERDRGHDVTGHDDQHLMWGALIRRSVVCCTPAPAPAPLSLRDDRVEGATTELTAVGGPRVRISLPPAASRVRTRFGPQLRLFLRVRPQRIPLRYNRASIGLHCGKSCTRKSAGHCAGSSPLPVTLGQSK